MAPDVENIRSSKLVTLVFLAVYLLILPFFGFTSVSHVGPGRMVRLKNPIKPYANILSSYFDQIFVRQLYSPAGRVLELFRWENCGTKLVGARVRFK